MPNPFVKLSEYWNLARKYAAGRRAYAVYIFFDMMYCRIRYGAPLDSYSMFEMYRLNRFAAGDFLTYKRQSILWTKFNSPEAHALFVDKFRFNQRFDKFIHRKYMLAEAKSGDAVRDFVRTQGSVIVKPVNDHCGRGIFLLDSADEGKVDEFIASLASNTYIVEQVVQNSSVLRKLNPNSLNTLRVVTCIDGAGKLHIISAALRIGGGTSCVDNAHSGGMACGVDLELGLVDSPAINRYGAHFLVHPLSGETIIGLQIPRWPEMKSYLERLAFVEPAARYVGWDIAMTDDGFELIEGNTDHDHDVMQMCHQIGLYRQLCSLYQ